METEQTTNSLVKLSRMAGADPGFFLGGGAVVSCSTSTPINHIVFFSQNTSCIRKPQVISGRVRTPCTLPLDPPLDGTFLIQFTGSISCLTLKKKWGGRGSISPGIILVRHGFYTRRSEIRLLSGVCTVKRATKDHKSEQFVLQHCRKTSLKAMPCARFTTHIKCLTTNQIVPVTKSC